MTTYHELDHQTISAFLSTLRSAGFLPESHIELNRLYHCRTDKKKDRRFAWYKLAYSKDDKAFVGTYGSFTLPTQREYYPVGGPATPERRQQAAVKQQAAKEQQQAAKEQQQAAKEQQQAAKEQQQAAKEQQQAAKEQQAAAQTAALAKRLLDAGTSNGLPEYLAAKNLPLVAPAKAIAGRDLLRLLPTTQGKVRAAVQRVTKNSTRLFLLVPVFRHSGELSNAQIILPEKVDIHGDGKQGNKLFLAGKGTLKGAYCPLTPLSDVPNGSELLLFEGYAKAIPAHLLGKPALVVFSVGNVDNVVTLFAPAEYPDKDAWTRREKALTYPRRFAVKNCADNDTAALTVAKKIQWRVKSVFPVFPGVKDWDDLFRAGGMKEVRRQLDEPRHLDAAYHTLTPKQFIADLKLVYPDGVSWLISDTGNGKTREVCRYADEHPGELTVLIAPTNMICDQTARALSNANKPFQLVMGTRAATVGLQAAKAYQYDAPGLCVTTLAKFVTSFDFAGCYYPVTLFIDEAHTFSSDAYRQADIAACYAMFSAAKKVILLTATPYLYHARGLQAAPKIFVEKAGRPKTRVKLLYFRDEFSTVKHFAEKGRVVVEINSRTGMNTLANALRKRGIQGVYTLSADDKDDVSKASIYMQITAHECLPADCRVLFTTKIYEMGINIRDTDISAFLVFGKRPLNSNRACDAVPAPADVKQGANRTRAAAPLVFYCLPEKMRNDNDTAFFGGAKYLRFLKRAERQAAEYVDETYTEGRAAALAEYNAEMREHAPRLLTWEQAAPAVSAIGIDMAINESYRAALLYAGAFLRRELNGYGLQFDGELTFDELTNGGAGADQDNSDNNKAIADARAETAADADLAFTQDVSDMATMTDEELKHHDSRHAPKMQFFRRMATREQAAALLLHVGRENRAYAQVKSRLTVLKAMTCAARAKKRIDTAAALMAFLRHGAFRGKDAAECVTTIFASDRVLRHELDAEWRTGNTRRMTEKRALSVLRKFKDIEKKHTEAGTVYRVSDNAPLVTLWKSATGNAPFSSVFFQTWLQEKSRFFEPSLPVAVGETPDTLPKETVYREAKLNVSGLNDLQAYLASELHDADTVLDDERAAIMAFGG